MLNKPSPLRNPGNNTDRRFLTAGVGVLLAHAVFADESNTEARELLAMLAVTVTARYAAGLADQAAALRQELAVVIQKAIGQLPPDQRTALVLSDVEGLDYQEIADATGAALGTVKSRLSRARAKVRDLLMEHQELLPASYRLTDS